MTAGSEVVRRLGILLMAGCLLSCSEAGPVRTAEGAVATFRRAMERGAFSVIYAQASPELRNAIREESFISLAKGVNGKLGPLVRSELKDYRTDRQPALTLVTLLYTTQYRQGIAFEKFVFVVAEGRAALGSYDIHSPALQGR